METTNMNYKSFFFFFLINKAFPHPNRSSRDLNRDPKGQNREKKIFEEIMAKKFFRVDGNYKPEDPRSSVNSKYRPLKNTTLRNINCI